MKLRGTKEFNESFCCPACGALFLEGKCPNPKCKPLGNARGRTQRGSGSVGINLSVSIEERELFIAAAHHYGLNPSEFFRALFEAWHSAKDARELLVQKAKAKGVRA